MGRYHYSFCIMSMLLTRMAAILNSHRRKHLIKFMERLKVQTSKRLSRPLGELVRYTLQRFNKIVKAKLLNSSAVGFIAIAERSRAESSALKLAARKERIEASQRKRVELENVQLRSKLTRLLEQVSFMATNMQKAIEESPEHEE